MNRSDATPLHFFLTGETTYNEGIVDECMIDEYCYIHEWECDDIVKDQFTDTEGQAFSLLIYVAGLLIGELEYEETEPGVYFISFVPSEIGLCELNAVFKIRRDVGGDPITLPSFSLWNNQDVTPGNIPWTLGANPNVVLTNVGDSSELLWADYPFIAGATYNIVIHYTLNSGGTLNQSSVTVRDDSFNLIFSNGVDVIGGGSDQTNPLIFTATEDCKKIAIRITSGGASFPQCNITLNSTTATEAVGANQIMATTDEIRFSNDIACNKKVEFKSFKNFAGLVYDEYSEYFQMRIPGVFFHERNPTDQKSLQISNSRVINTSAVLRKQKKFDIQDTTQYMHTKIQLIFLHAVSGSLLIDGVEWTIEEAYNQDDSTPDSYPLKRADTYLTRKNYVKRNVI